MNVKTPFLYLLVFSLLAPAAPVGAGIIGHREAPARSRPAPIQKDFMDPFARDVEELTKARAIKDPKEREEAIAKFAVPAPKGWFVRSMVFFNYAMTALIGAQAAVGHAQNPHTLIPLALLAPLGYLAADATVEVAHWSVDDVLSPHNKAYGETVRDFWKHHMIPGNLNKEDFVGNIATVSALTSPLFIAVAATDMPPAIKSTLLVFLVAGMHSTAIHRWAHMPRPPRVAKWLQDRGVFLTKRQHMGGHHAAPYDGDYALVSGHVSPLFRKLKIWDKLRATFWKRARQLPHSWKEAPYAIPPEVIAELRHEVETLPPEEVRAEVQLAIQQIWSAADFSPANVDRADVKELISLTRTRWRAEFVANRRTLWQEYARENEAAAIEGFRQEQSESPWIYGKTETPLF